MKKVRNRSIFKYVCLYIYIACVIVLIVEASMNGKLSSSQSNAVGGAIADVFNDISGDQTVAVIPTDITIDNKISEAKIKTTYQLSVTTSPSNSSFKSINFVSSNPSIATVSGSGLINFIDIGEVTITALNKDYPNLTDSLTIIVSNVEAENITSTIDANITDDGEYELYIGHQYTIDTIFNPTNTTNKDLTYEVSDSSFLSISDDGVITPKKYSASTIIEIKVKHDSLEEIIKVSVDYENKVELDSISLSVPNIFVGQTVTPKATFEPSDATFKDYKLLSSDSSILKVSGNKLVGVKAGIVTVTVQSTIYPEIYNEVIVEVEEQPEINLDNTTVSLSKSLYVGNQTTIKIVKSPSYGYYTKVEYESEDTNVATVTTNGVVKAISNGSTIINVTIYTNDSSKNYKLPITVETKVDVVTEDFTLNTSNISINCMEEVDLSHLISVTEWVPSKPTNTTLVFSLNDSSFGSINRNILTITKAGITTIDVTHLSSGITKTIDLVSLFDFDIIFDIQTSDINMSVDDVITFRIIDGQSEIKTQYYHFSIDDTIASIEESDGVYKITALYEGNVTLRIVPFVEEYDFFDFAHDYDINIQNIYTSELDFHIINLDNNIVILDDHHDGYKMTLIENLEIETILSLDTTTYNLVYTSSDKNILEVQPNGKLIPHSPGKVTVTIKETYSGLEKNFIMYVYNYIKINADESYIIKGEAIIYNANDNKYHIANGNSIEFKINFDDATTYQTVTYSSSNELVATVGQDGTITPKFMGTAKITAICDDGILDPIVITIELQVEPLNLINDLSDFFYKVRKGIGHFGAFFVLGIFSTLTWLLFFTKKKMIYSIPVNIVLGFVVAAITEIIQYFVPGRYGVMSDVLLDFSGFIISAVIISIIFIIREIIIYVKNKKNDLDTAS